MENGKTAPPRLLRLAEVLRILDISRSTFYALSKKGELRLPVWKVGGVRRYRACDVEREVQRRLR
jgi:predicted DNA-binding transcriptional regulator AlpA